MHTSKELCVCVVVLNVIDLFGFNVFLVWFEFVLWLLVCHVCLAAFFMIGLIGLWDLVHSFDWFAFRLCVLVVGLVGACLIGFA